mmetsp:Transcript_46004/g.114139  ORF Transcript_46004/g.114139 Transcript_46004/m.114139 type:complete len:250 (-) Transcript_46004:716-1465(-)
MSGSIKYGLSGITWPYSEIIHSNATFASGSSTDLRKAPMPPMMRSLTPGYLRSRFFIQMIASALTWSMSTSRNFISCSTTMAEHEDTFTPILPIAWTAPLATDISGSVTYSAISSTASLTLLVLATDVRISSLSSLTHAGSLYLQKKCLNSLANTSGARCVSKTMCLRQVKACSKTPAVINVSIGALRREKTCWCTAGMSCVRLRNTLVAPSTTAELECRSLSSRRFMMLNVSACEEGLYRASNSSTTH